jgi:TRAP-type C4-dicarboxylate transport system permease small subunit
MVRKIRIIIEKITTVIAALLMLFLVILAFIQVLLRNLFSLGFNAIDELMRNGVLWIAFIGAVLTTLRGQHISIDILPRYLRGKSKKIVEWIIGLSSFVICLIFVRYSISFVILECQTGSIIAGFCLAWIIELIIPVGFTLLGISFLLKTIESKDNKSSDND